MIQGAPLSLDGRHTRRVRYAVSKSVYPITLCAKVCQLLYFVVVSVINCTMNVVPRL
jgi:hypothetical protein